MRKSLTIGCILCIVFFLLSYQGDGEELSVYKSDQKTVEVKGEIMHPGVYEVAWEATLEEVIEVAGGIREQGTLDSLNLGQIPEHRTVIVIPKQNMEVCISLNSATLEELDALPRCWS